MSHIVHDPARRQRYCFRRAADDALQVEVWAAPGANVPPHVHPTQEERFEVLAGMVTFWVDGERRSAGPGDTLVAPPGSVHAFENEDDEAHLMVEVRPALNLQEFLESAAGLSRARRITPRGFPKSPRTLLQLAILARHFQPCTYLARPPLHVQRVLLWPLVQVARLFGYRAPDVIAAARSAR